MPSAWPYPRVEHWKLLLRARAVENLLYVGAVNGSAAADADTDADPELVGRSTVYEPWGTPVVTTGEEPAVVIADVDPDRVETVRAEFPALDDRR